MKHVTRRVITCAVAMLLMASAALAQAPQGAAPAGAPGATAAGGGRRGQQAPLASPNPIYVSIRLEVDVNKPAAEVWARVGGFCDIGDRSGLSCQIVSGKDRELGAVRSGEPGAVRSVATEILVAKTDLSYTYTQPVRVGQFYPLYHGTLEAKPVTAATSKLIYSLVWDASDRADDAAREAQQTQRATQIQGALNNLKILAEVETPPARDGRGRGAPGGGVPGGAAMAPGGGQGQGQ